jgi:Pyridoxamine 5'-phosphate oxidase
MPGHPELNAMARRVIDGNHFMTLATLDPTGRPRLSPVIDTAARYSDFYWVSTPESTPDARHSRNLNERPDVQIVISDSTAAVGEGDAVYLSATARPVRDDELKRVCAEAFRTTAGARRFQPTNCAQRDRFVSMSPLRHRARSTCPAPIAPMGVASIPASQPIRRQANGRRGRGSPWSRIAIARASGGSSQTGLLPFVPREQPAAGRAARQKPSV